MRSRIRLISVIAFTAVAFIGLAEVGAAEKDDNEAGMFPFMVSYDAPDNATNVSRWLHRPAGRYGFVRAKDGHLVTDEGPIRFWATNLCFKACFPSQEQAERMAARMARLGINCVRMHHMDTYSIWGDSPNRTTIDPKQLAKLDYLIYQFKKHGIYTNLNLHVSRWLDKRDGFPNREGRPRYDKGLDNFEPRIIELQKKYARDLLMHVNPYTKTAYADEPAIAMVEINNENALFAVWAWDQLDNLADPYRTTFRKLWNKWLRAKYGDTKRLAKAWNSETVPLGGEMLINGDFSQGFQKPWRFERRKKCKVESSLQSGKVAAAEGENSFLRFVVTGPGSVPCRTQLINSGFELKADAPYTLTFKMRADAKQKIAIACMMDHAPWENLGLYNTLELGPEWKEYRYVFTASKADKKARIDFTRIKPGTYELADVSLRHGGIVGLRPGESLEDDSVPVLLHGQLCTTPTAQRDFIDFLWQTEYDYWLAMYRFLKDDLGVRSVVSGTQRGYGPLFPQAKLDYIDAHAYWQHPHFPGRRWDRGNWTIRNTAMVNEPAGTLGRLAGWRVWQMPYTVSEYNHPAPNVYAAEGFPMIAAVGRFQNWDGVFSFAYAHRLNVEPQRIENFFDIRSNTAQLVHMPACAAMFLRGDVQTAEKTYLARISPKTEREMLYKKLKAWGLGIHNFGLDPLTSLVNGVALELVDNVAKGGVAKDGDAKGKDGGDVIDVVGADGKKVENVKPPIFPPTQKIFVSDSGQLRWDVSRENEGVFTVDTPRTKVFTGFGSGQSFTLGDVRLTLGKTRLDWATVSMVCLDGEGFDKPGRILIAATGLVHNSGAVLRKVGNNRFTLGNDWGKAPVMCEGVAAEIILPIGAERVRVYLLDGSGNRRGQMEVGNDNGRAKVVLGPKHKTLWYEVEIR